MDIDIETIREQIILEDEGSVEGAQDEAQEEDDAVEEAKKDDIAAELSSMIENTITEYESISEEDMAQREEADNAVLSGVDEAPEIAPLPESEPPVTLEDTPGGAESSLSPIAAMVAETMEEESKQPGPPLEDPHDQAPSMVEIMAQARNAILEAKGVIEDEGRHVKEIQAGDDIPEFEDDESMDWDALEATLQPGAAEEQPAPEAPGHDRSLTPEEDTRAQNDTPRPAIAEEKKQIGSELLKLVQSAEWQDSEVKDSTTIEEEGRDDASANTNAA